MQQPPSRGGWRWWACLALLEVISLLPAVWGVWCTAIFLWLFPVTQHTWTNVAMMLVVLLSFIASAVRRDPNDPAKKVHLFLLLLFSHLWCSMQCRAKPSPGLVH